MQISPIFKSGHKHTLIHTHGFLDSLDPVYGLLITSSMENQFLPWSDLFTPWLGLDSPVFWAPPWSHTSRS